MLGRVGKLGTRPRQLPFDDDVKRVDDPRNVSEDRQDDVDPKVLSKPFLKEDAEWWQQYRNDDPDDVHASRSDLRASFGLQ